MNELTVEAVGSVVAAAEFAIEARKAFNPGRKKPCAVCGKYQGLAQAHHLIPLALQARRGASLADQTFEWLCPTHHVAVHALIDQSLVQVRRDAVGLKARATQSAIDVIGSLDQAELRAVLRLSEMAFAEPNVEQLRKSATARLA